MRRIIIAFLFVLLFCTQVVYAAEMTAPKVPDSGAVLMPDESRTFGEGIWEIIQGVLPLIRPNLAEAIRVSSALIAATLLVSILSTFSEKNAKLCDSVGALTVAALLLHCTHSMIQLGAATIAEISEYERLLLPVQTAIIAAQGGAGTAAALYSATALFNALLSRLIHKCIIPMIYLFLALTVSSSCLDESILIKMKEIIKNSILWMLKTLISVFTGYLGITRVISSSVDAAALKAAKATISTVIPVVGGMLSEASDAVLAGADLIKNSVGIYGIYAVLAVFTAPYVQIGAQYLILKYTSAICSVFGTKKMSCIIEDFSNAMRLILASAGTLCILLMVSSICFMKGVG